MSLVEPSLEEGIRRKAEALLERSKLYVGVIERGGDEKRSGEYYRGYSDCYRNVADELISLLDHKGPVAIALQSRLKDRG